MPTLGKPARCDNCRRKILFGYLTDDTGLLVLGADGKPQRVVVNADPSPTGQYQYVRGSLTHPVLRELDDEERLTDPGGHERYSRHFDTAAVDRRTVAAGADR